MKLTIPTLVVIIFVISLISFGIFKVMGEVTVIFVTKAQYNTLVQVTTNNQNKVDQLEKKIDALARIHDNLVAVLAAKKLITLPEQK